MHEQREFWLEGMRLKWHHLLFLQPSVLPPRHSIWCVMRDSLACDTTTIPPPPAARRPPCIAETLTPRIFSACDPLERARRIRLFCWQTHIKLHSWEGTYFLSGLRCTPRTGVLHTRLKGCGSRASYGARTIFPLAAVGLGNPCQEKREEGLCFSHSHQSLRGPAAIVSHRSNRAPPRR